MKIDHGYPCLNDKNRTDDRLFKCTNMNEQGYWRIERVLLSKGNDGYKYTQRQKISLLAPHFFGSTELVDAAGHENYEICQEEGNSWPDWMVIRLEDIISKEDPRGGDQRRKAHDEGGH